MSEPASVDGTKGYRINTNIGTKDASGTYLFSILYMLHQVNNDSVYWEGESPFEIIMPVSWTHNYTDMLIFAAMFFSDIHNHIWYIVDGLSQSNLN